MAAPPPPVVPNLTDMEPYQMGAPADPSLRLKLDLRHAVRLSLQLTSETGHVTVETARFDRPSLRGLGRMQPWPADANSL